MTYLNLHNENRTIIGMLINFGLEHMILTIPQIIKAVYCLSTQLCALATRDHIFIKMGLCSTFNCCDKIPDKNIGKDCFHLQFHRLHSIFLGSIDSGLQWNRTYGEILWQIYFSHGQKVERSSNRKGQMQYVVPPHWTPTPSVTNFLQLNSSSIVPPPPKSLFRFWIIKT